MRESIQVSFLTNVINSQISSSKLTGRMSSSRVFEATSAFHDTSSSTAQLTKREKKEAKKRGKELKKIAREQQQALDYLTLESNFNEVSQKRGLKDYELWCDEVGLKKLRDEVKRAAQSANHLLDKTQHALEVIETHRSHAEEQQSRSVQNHSDLIDYILSELKSSCSALLSFKANELNYSSRTFQAISII